MLTHIYADDVPCQANLQPETQADGSTICVCPASSPNYSSLAKRCIVTPSPPPPSLLSPPPPVYTSGERSIKLAVAPASDAILRFQQCPSTCAIRPTFCTKFETCTACGECTACGLFGSLPCPGALSAILAVVWSRSRVSHSCSANTPSFITADGVLASGEPCVGNLQLVDSKTVPHSTCGCNYPLVKAHLIDACISKL